MQPSHAWLACSQTAICQPCRAFRQGTKARTGSALAPSNLHFPTYADQAPPNAKGCTASRKHAPIRQKKAPCPAHALNIHIAAMPRLTPTENAPSRHGTQHTAHSTQHTAFLPKHLLCAHCTWLRSSHVAARYPAQNVPPGEGRLAAWGCCQPPDAKHRQQMLWWMLDVGHWCGGAHSRSHCARAALMRAWCTIASRAAGRLVGGRLFSVYSSPFSAGAAGCPCFCVGRQHRFTRP